MVPPGCRQVNTAEGRDGGPFTAGKEAWLPSAVPPGFGGRTSGAKCGPGCFEDSAAVERPNMVCRHAKLYTATCQTLESGLEAPLV